MIQPQRFLKIFLYYHCNGLFWCRVNLGYGIHIKNIKKHPLLFSERIKRNHQLVIKNWLIKILNPIKQKP